MELSATTTLVAIAAVFLISFMKGAFGGGFAIVGIPLLSLVMDPIAAGGLLAPLLIAMDLVGLCFWKPNTWSKPDLQLLVPGLLFGIAAGCGLFYVLDHRAIAILMAVITLLFVGAWFMQGEQLVKQQRSLPKAFAAGAASGVTTMIAHSGGPPLAMYLLPLGLSKQIYAGTTSLFFTVGNLLKAIPWLALARPSASAWALVAICFLAVPTGIWAGWRVHTRLNQRQMYRACYALLILTSCKLLYDGITGYRN